MAQSGYTPISLYFSATGAAVPTAGNLVAGELALNTNDGKLYYKNSSGVVTLLASATTVTNSFSAGTTGLTPNTATTGAVTLAGTLAVANGGTGLTAGTSGGVLAYTATGTLASSTALAANALVIGGGAGAAPSTTTTGTGVVTALGVNTGSAGAFVVNGGALGSPSSVGTMPAFTLGGTVSGGGNQINNVIIGTTTPLAGSFTTGTFQAATGAFTGVQVGTGSTNNIGWILGNASSSLAAIWSTGVTPSTTNYSFRSDAGLNIYINASDNVTTRIGNVTVTNVASTGLAVTGTLSATGTLSGGTSGTAYSFSGSAPATSLTLTSGGDVGIGTSSPDCRLMLQTPSGTACQLNLAQSAVTNYRISIPASTDALTFVYGASTERMRLDSAGNLGLGVTPSAWNAGYKAFVAGGTNGNDQVGGIASGSGITIVSTNYYRSATPSDLYAGTGFAMSYKQTSGEHQWLTAASGTAGNTISFTQAMTLDASGNLGIGTTTPTDSSNFSRALDVSGPSGAAVYTRTAGSATNFTYYGNYGNNGYINNNGSGSLLFYNNGSERARIDSSGNLLVAKTAMSTATVGVELRPGGRVVSTLAASTSADDTYEVYSTGAGAYRFYVGMDGTINATSIVITAISDERLKENVRDINTGLDAIMALKPRRFDWREGKGQDKKDVAGFIAQEFETVFPECVSTSKAGADGIEYKNINHETLIPTLVKAIQEQQALITQLTARITALETP